MIKVFGVGDGGVHALAKMMSELPRGVEYVAVNTDADSLAKSHAARKIQLGRQASYQWGAGGIPTVGRQAAEDSTDDLTAAMSGTSRVFIVGRFGGGTGTGATAVIAEIAQRCGQSPIVIATLPFDFEGQPRRDIAQQGVNALRQAEIVALIISLDALIPFVHAQPDIVRLYALADALLAWHVLSRCVP